MKDVTPSADVLPDNSSRPLIVSNHASVADPMVVSADAGSAEATTSPLLNERAHRTRLVVPSAEKYDTNKKADETEPATEDSNKRQKTVTLVPVPTEDSAIAPKGTPEPTETAEEKNNDSAEQETEPAVSSSEELPPEDSKIIEEFDKRTSLKTDKESEAEAAEREQSERISELIENKTYFVSVHQRTSSVTVLLLVIILVAAAVAAIAYMVLGS